MAFAISTIRDAFRIWYPANPHFSDLVFSASNFRPLVTAKAVAGAGKAGDWLCFRFFLLSSDFCILNSAVTIGFVWLCFLSGKMPENRYFYRNLFIPKNLCYIAQFNIGFVFSKKVDL